MNKKIILHIGFGKTGTSSIQGMLFNNRSNLKRHGIYYPKTGILGTAHHQLAEFKSIEMSEDTSVIFGTILREFSENKCKLLLLSTEYFCFCRTHYIGQIAEILKGWEVEILFYVREQVELISSAFLQKIKAGDGRGFNWDIKCFLEQNMDAFDFNIRINSWASSFGEKSIKARLYGEPKENYDVCSDFLTVIGFDGKLTSPVHRANISLLPEFVNVVKLIDTSDCSAEFRRAAIGRFIEMSNELKKSSSRKVLDAKLSAYIKGYYKISNTVFEEKYFQSNSGSI